MALIIFKTVRNSLNECLELLNPVCLRGLEQCEYQSCKYSWRGLDGSLAFSDIQISPGTFQLASKLKVLTKMPQLIFQPRIWLT